MLSTVERRGLWGKINSDYLYVEIETEQNFLGCSIRRYRLKVMQRSQPLQKLKVILKQERLTSDRRSRQNIVYVDYGLGLEQFTEHVKGYFGRKFNVEKEAISLRWDKGNIIQLWGDSFDGRKNSF